MIVYLARDIQAFVMYCVNGTSRSSLLIESSDSMILILCISSGGFSHGSKGSMEPPFLPDNLSIKQAHGAVILEKYSDQLYTPANYKLP